MKTSALRSGYLAALSSGWTVAPREKRSAISALRQERVSVRYAFDITTDRLARAYEQEKQRQASDKR